MSDSTFDKILERLPYTDGGARRRFVSGGTLVIGAAFVYSGFSQQIFEGVDAKTVISSPILAAGLVLIIYAIGSIVELFGELFFVRAASGVFWVVAMPARKLKANGRSLSSIIRMIFIVFMLPLLAIWSFFMGFLGYTNYKISFKGQLSIGGQKVFESLPERVALGLTNPVGNDAELSLRYIVELFHKEDDRKWARNLVRRAKDISAITTSLFLFFLLGILSGSFGPWAIEKADPKLIPIRQKEIAIQRLIQDIGEGIPLITDFKQTRFYIDRRSLSQHFDRFGTSPLTLVKLDGYINNFENSLIKEIKEISSSLDASQQDEKSKAINIIRTQVDKIRTAINELQTSLAIILPQSASKEALRVAQAIGITAPFLFLYIGFFSSLRNSIMTILEGLSLKRE